MQSKFSEDWSLMLPARANSTRGGEAAESDEWQAVSEQAVVGILARPPLNRSPPTLCFNALESSSANMGTVPSWHRGWHCFCWHGDAPLLEKEALSLRWPEKSCCTSSTGHTLSRVTLCDIVNLCGEKIGAFFFFFETIVHCDNVLYKPAVANWHKLV